MQQTEFVEKESYKHKLAKDMLYDILVKIDNAGDSCCYGPLSWRSNYGVFKELKFYETSDPYYFECSYGLVCSKKKLITGNEWFDSEVDRGKILFVPDICIFHKGTPVIFIEVVHKNNVSDDKIKKIKKWSRGYYIKIYEVYADQILGRYSEDYPIKFNLIAEL